MILASIDKVRKRQNLMQLFALLVIVGILYILFRRFVY